MNFADSSGHGIASWAKAKLGSAKKAVTSAVTKVKPWAGNTVSKVKTAVSNAVSKAKTTVSNAYNKAKTTISNTYTKAKTTVSNAYSKAKTWAQNTRESLHSWGSSKLKEADNILNSWAVSVEKTVKHFCTTANRVKEDVVEFVKNIDWKKVAVGVGVTMAFTGVVLLSGGSAAPVLLSAAIGSGSGAVFNGVLTAMNGGSIADIAESASDGFMWGGIGGSLGGSTTVLLSELAAAGSSLIGNPFFQRLVQGAADTAVDTAQSASKGLPVTLEGVLINMTYNTLMAGGIGSGGKQAVNEAVDETADSIGDSVRREVKSGSASAAEMAKPQGGCFTGETLIPTAKGEKAIREIRVDDLVLSENPETGERGYKEVRRLYLHESRPLIHVFVGNEEIKATPEHPFWVEGKGFVTADALRAGDEVRLLHFQIC